ncbi:hypothetical protein STRCI_004406 [Streptomyces cinnabarinus]|uniref:Uncharacterized protein n=1 Tax=Streptomyces cinnabarinus TaxID=67287 RepID=A0ABY7KJK1_9ACTN|nr:hypothetical protein [Streptomyces cinnabarinus]WAZ23089.1 hypothetical protein STRCI_004406 [Streptomyces cinnabarinus]
MEIAPELLMALAAGTAGAAGQQIWESLKGLLRRRPQGAAPSGEAELEALGRSADDADRARELANVLALRAVQDPAFAQALESWRQKAEAWDAARPTGSGGVHNEISGGDFKGPVIQARDINGPLNFGR